MMFVSLFIIDQVQRFEGHSGLVSNWPLQILPKILISLLFCSFWVCAWHCAFIGFASYLFSARHPSNNAMTWIWRRCNCCNSSRYVLIFCSNVFKNFLTWVAIPLAFRMRLTRCWCCVYTRWCSRWGPVLVRFGSTRQVLWRKIIVELYRTQKWQVLNTFVFGGLGQRACA